MDPVDNSDGVSRTEALAKARLLAKGNKKPPQKLKSESAVIIARHRRRVGQEIDDVRRILTKAQDIAGSCPIKGFDEEDLAEYRKILEAREEAEPAEDGENETASRSPNQLDEELEDEEKDTSDYSTSMECSGSTEEIKPANDANQTQDANPTKALHSTADAVPEDKHLVSSKSY